MTMTGIRKLVALGALALACITANMAHAEALFAKPAFTSNIVAAQNPNCTSGGQPNITTATLAFFTQTGATGNLRPFFCVDASSPASPPQYTGDSLVAYTWLSNQLYPGSNGNIRGLYGSVNINWGTLNWPSYSSACKCTQGDFEAVKTQVRQEIQSVADVGSLFSAIATSYVNPLFIQNGAVIVAAVSELQLANQPVTVNTGAVIEKSVFNLLTNVFDTGVGGISPWGPVAISALLNLSKTSNGGTVPNTFSGAASSLENQLPATFGGIITQLASLQATIIADYSLYTQIGLYSSGVTPVQLAGLSTSGALAYRKQLYRDLLPTVASIVFFSPFDNHLGGGANVYPLNGLTGTYSGKTAGSNIITYLHFAGWWWNNKTYYYTEAQMLTSNATYNSGDLATGALCANNLLNAAIYTTVFDHLKFTYDELLTLPGMQKLQQCSLCQSSSECNAGQCRPNNSCR